MSRTIHIIRTGGAILVNGKQIKGYGGYVPADQLLDEQERKALDVFLNRIPKVQSSIYTL